MLMIGVRQAQRARCFISTRLSEQVKGSSHTVGISQPDKRAAPAHRHHCLNDQEQASAGVTSAGFSLGINEAP